MHLCFLCLFLSLSCSNEPAKQSTPSGPAAAVQTNSYNGTGIVKAVNPNLPAIEIDHEEIVGLMPAMQMEFPVKDSSLLNGISVNDRIDFTVENATGEMRIIAIKKKE